MQTMHFYGEWFIMSKISCVFFWNTLYYQKSLNFINAFKRYKQK